MKPLSFLLILCFGVGVAGCARDCSTLVDQRCKTAGLDQAACAELSARAAAVPAQACEAVLLAQESRGKR